MVFASYRSRHFAQLQLRYDKWGRVMREAKIKAD